MALHSHVDLYQCFREAQCLILRGWIWRRDVRTKWRYLQNGGIYLTPHNLQDRKWIFAFVELSSNFLVTFLWLIFCYARWRFKFLKQTEVKTWYARVTKSNFLRAHFGNNLAYGRMLTEYKHDPKINRIRIKHSSNRSISVFEAIAFLR